MNWVEFLTDYQIEYVSRGPNTRRGEVSCRCPFCGDDDPSQHLGISLSSENWGCLRSQTHRGHSPVRLIEALLGCGTSKARDLYTFYSQADPDAFDHPLIEPKAPIKTKVFLPDGMPIDYGTGTKRYWTYLYARGFDDPALLCQRYRLKACTTGRYEGRIIIPLYDKTGLVGFQGRSIYGNQHVVRYLSSSEDVKKTLFGLDTLDGGDVLYICEGPFDAMKLEFYGEGIQATCTFGVTLTQEQIALIRGLQKKYKCLILLFDPDIGPVYDWLEWLPGVTIGELPAGAKDPGDMSRTQIRSLLG
jgi:hypothetical protein